MACSSCGKNSSSRVGNTLNTAIIFGDPTNEVHRARVIDDIPGMQTGSIKYVRGSMVQQLVAGITCWSSAYTTYSYIAVHTVLRWRYRVYDNRSG